MRNYKVEVYDFHFHGVYRFHSLEKAKRYAEFARINHPAASIILYERHRFFWWKEYEERKDD